MSIKLYDYELSQSCYRVRLLLSFLGLSYETIIVDVTKGEQKTPEYLRLNPLGKIPYFEDGAAHLRDSHTIIVYLARQYGSDRWLPSDPAEAGEVMQWIVFNATEMSISIEGLRRHKFGLYPTLNPQVATEKAADVLQFLNDHLENHDWLALSRPTLAELALFPGLALSSEVNISLTPYPHVERWLNRVKQLPGFIGMTGISTELVAA